MAAQNFRRKVLLMNRKTKDGIAIRMDRQSDSRWDDIAIRMDRQSDSRWDGIDIKTVRRGEAKGAIREQGSTSDCLNLY